MTSATASGPLLARLDPNGFGPGTLWRLIHDWEEAVPGGPANRAAARIDALVLDAVARITALEEEVRQLRAQAALETSAS